MTTDQFTTDELQYIRQALEGYEESRLRIARRRDRREGGFAVERTLEPFFAMSRDVRLKALRMEREMRERVTA